MPPAQTARHPANRLADLSDKFRTAICGPVGGVRAFAFPVEENPQQE
jgi:hypothetical protein